MKKFVGILLVGALLTSGVFAGGKSEAKKIIRYADVQAENDTETMAARELARVVKEMSGGKLEIQVFPGGQLGDMKDIIHSAQMGSIEMCRNNPGWLADAGAPRLNVFSLPFIFKNLEHANKVIDSSIGKDLLDEIQKKNLKLIGLGYLEPSLRYFFFKNKEVKKMSDLKGMKLRVPTNAMNTEMVDAFGASPTPIAYAELYNALQTGIVDGAENPLKGFINMKFSEVCKYFTFTGHQYEPSIVLVSEIFWNKLSAEEQKILKDAMAKTSAYYKDISKNKYNDYIEAGKKAGVKFTEVDNIQEWQDAVRPLYQKFGKGMEDLITAIGKVQ